MEGAHSQFPARSTTDESRWQSNVSGSPPPVDIVPDEPGVLHEAAWKPEGSVVLPECFKRVREYALRDVSFPSNPLLDMQGGDPDMVCENIGKATGLPTESGRPVIQVQVEEIQDEGQQDFDAEGRHAVPTIMVSNSTAIVPLSLESSQSLATAPLAIRRGQKMLPPITVPRLVTPAASYPDIPSPFLGSPSSSRPSFERSDGEIRKPPQDLEHICADLYARLPVVCLPPLSPTWETLEPAGVAHQQAPELDAEDDWAGPQEFVNLHAATIPQLFQSTPPKTSLPASPGSGSWGATPTLVDTTQDSTPLQAHSPEMMGIDAKKQRRKTVIIETSPTPQRTSLSPLAAQEANEHTGEQEPIPFETPAGHLVSCSACHNSVLAPSRPLSTASMRPVRGILKGKKSVRFSMVPECVVVDDDQARKEAARPRSGSVPPAAKPRSPLARRSSVAPAPPPSPVSPSKENESTSWPRHPALRAMARHTADLSAPKPQTPTPVMVAAERRSPLRSINLRQSLPVKRDSTAVHHEKGAQKRITVGDIGQPRRLMKTASAPGPVRTSVAKVDIENIAAKGEISKPKSRMPVPLRGIFTFPKLRS